jgi:hypothetical protein
MAGLPSFRVSASGRAALTILKPVTHLLNHPSLRIRMASLSALCLLLTMMYYAGQHAIAPLTAQSTSRRQILSSGLNSAERMDCYSTCAAEESMQPDRIHQMRMALAGPEVKHEAVLKVGLADQLATADTTAAQHK